MTDHQNNSIPKKYGNEIDFIKILASLLKGKYIILGCCVLTLPFVFYKYKKQKQFAEIATLVASKGATNNFGVVGTGILQRGGSSGLGDLQSTLTSNRILSKVWDSINLRVAYQKEGFFYNREILNAPFVVVFEDSERQPIDISFKIKLLKDGTFHLFLPSLENTRLFDYSTNNYIYKEVDFEGIDDVFDFGATIRSDFFNFKILKRTPNQKPPKEKKTYFFSFQHKQVFIRNTRAAVKVEKSTENSRNNLIISMIAEVPEKGITILNTSIFFLREYEIFLKNIESNYSIDYINQKIDNALDSMKYFEGKQILYRQNKKILSINSKTFQIINRLQSIDKEKTNFKNKKSYIDYLKNYVSENMGKKEMMSPSLMGIDDPNIISSYSALNSLSLSLMDNKFGAAETTPYRYEIQRRIEQYQQKFLHSIEEREKSSDIKLKQLNKEQNRWERELKILPNYEQELINIHRLLSLSSERYGFLLRKRENLEIIRANNLPDTEIVDSAYYLGSTKLKPLKYYLLIALGAGLFVGVFIVLGIDFLKYLRQELKKLKTA